MDVTYVGPHDAVQLDLGDGVAVTVARGGKVTVSDELAAGLLDQPTNWQPAKAAEPEQKKAASTKKEA
jgi:hypothetical protein